MYFFVRSATGMLRAGSSSSGSSSKDTQPSLPLVSFHTGSNTACASFTSLSVIAQAIASSSCPASRSCWMSSSNRPVLMRSAMMIGFEVAPVAPSARLRAISSGSTESSQSLVPRGDEGLQRGHGDLPGDECFRAMIRTKQWHADEADRTRMKRIEPVTASASILFDPAFIRVIRVPLLITSARSARRGPRRAPAACPTRSSPRAGRRRRTAR